MKFKTIGSTLIVCSLFSAQIFSKTISYTNYDTKDHQPIFNNDWKVNGYKAKVGFHKSKSTSANLVVFSPGWGGADKYKSAFKNIQSKLGKSNHYAYLHHSKSIDLAARTVSIFQAIKAIKKTGVSIKKVIVIGASGGAQEGIHTTHTKVANALGEGVKVDAVVGFYPSCRVKYSDKTFNNAQVLMFLGGKDGTAPAKLCYDLKQNGGLSHAKITEFPKAGHSWLFSKSQNVNKTRTWQDCTLEIQQSGVWTSGNLSSKDGIDPFLTAMGKQCATKKQLLSGRNKKAYKESINATINFVNNL